MESSKVIKILGIGIFALLCSIPMKAQQAVSPETMQSVYNEVRTPYKYGLVKGDLSIGVAYTDGDVTKAHEWQRYGHPVLSP